MKKNRDPFKKHNTVRRKIETIIDDEFRKYCQIPLGTLDERSSHLLSSKDSLLKRLNLPGQKLEREQQQLQRKLIAGDSLFQKLQFARDENNTKRAIKTTTISVKLQKKANTLREKFPSYSVSRIADRILEEKMNEGLSKERIRKIIKNPSKKP